MKKYIYISVTNDLVTDQRIHRIAKSIRDSGYNVTLIGRRLKDSNKITLDGIKTRRFRLIINHGPLFYAIYNLRLFTYLLFRKSPSVLLSNDLDTLPANYLVSFIRGSKLVYDSHEYFTEVPELIDRSFVKKIWSVIERILVPGVDAAYTVNDSLAKIYSVKYGLEFGVIRNVPDTGLKEKFFSIPEAFSQNGFLIYQGAVNKDRGLEELIDIIADEKNIWLVIAGDGDIYDELKVRVNSKECSERVLFTGKIEPERLKGLTKNAALGLSLEKNTNLNYYYSLPNKLFDYIRAGIPVLCSDFPEMRRIIDEQKVGMTVDPSDKAEIIKRINYMISTPGAREGWIKNCRQASEKLRWKTEQNKLIDIYKKVGIELGWDS